MPASIFRSVLFPAPFRPTTPRMSPGANAKLTSFTAVIVAGRAVPSRSKRRLSQIPISSLRSWRLSCGEVLYLLLTFRTSKMEFINVGFPFWPACNKGAEENTDPDDHQDHNWV